MQDAPLDLFSSCHFNRGEWSLSSSCSFISPPKMLWDVAASPGNTGAAQDSAVSPPCVLTQPTLRGLLLAWQLCSLPTFSDWGIFHPQFPLQQALLLVRCCRCLQRFMRVLCQKPNFSWTFSSWPQQQVMGALLQSSWESREPKTSLIKLLSFYSHHCVQLQDNALGLLIFFPLHILLFINTVPWGCFLFCLEMHWCEARA